MSARPRTEATGRGAQDAAWSVRWRWYCVEFLTAVGSGVWSATWRTVRAQRTLFKPEPWSARVQVQNLFPCQLPIVHCGTQRPPHREPVSWALLRLAVEAGGLSHSAEIRAMQTQYQALQLWEAGSEAAKLCATLCLVVSMLLQTCRKHRCC